MEVEILKGGGVGTCGRERWEWCLGSSRLGRFSLKRVLGPWASMTSAFSFVNKNPNVSESEETLEVITAAVPSAASLTTGR